MTWWWICALFHFIADPEASGPFLSTAALTQPTAPRPDNCSSVSQSSLRSAEVSNTKGRYPWPFLCTPVSMAFLSVFTPVLAVVLCLVIGFVLVKSWDTETTSTSPGKSKGATKGEKRPWVDQDLQDDTEITAKEDGES